MSKESNEKYPRLLPRDFASKFVIDTMVRNTIKQALVNSICSNMKQYGMWMVYKAYKSINKSCITNMNRDPIMSKNENCNSNSEYSQHNTTRWFLNVKSNKNSNKQKSFDIIWFMLMLLGQREQSISCYTRKRHIKPSCNILCEL